MALRIGVVGCGRIGKLHINNLINSVPGVEVVAAARSEEHTSELQSLA